MRQPFLLLLFSIFISVASSCTRIQDRILTYQYPELGKVLDHYAAPADSLKRKAAIFLFRNMEGHYGMSGPGVIKRASIFAAMDTISIFTDGMSNEEKRAAADSAVNFEDPVDMSPVMTPDGDIITADFIISNIDYAFLAWENAAWTKEVNFEDFCEYILPYRVRDERLQLYRPKFYNDYLREGMNVQHPDSVKEVHQHLSWNLGIEMNFDPTFTPLFPYTQSVDDVLKGGVGGCETTSLLGVSAMRSAGLPIALDFLPHWGSSGGSHFLTYVKSRQIKRKLITNENLPVDTWSIVDFSTEFRAERHRFEQHELPRGMYVQYVKTIPKMFRYMYSHNEKLKKINRKFSGDYIAPQFRTTTIKDVTGEYIETVDTDIRVQPKFRNRPIHLCVFDLNGWAPVDIAVADAGSVHFSGIGKNIVYLPTIYAEGEHSPVSDPFMIDTKGKKHVFRPDISKKTAMRLLRKTALYAYTVAHTEVLKGGHFEGANKVDFSDARVLFQVNYYPFYRNEKKIGDPNKYRYVRYVFPKDNQIEADNIAEISFYGENGNTPLTGEFIGTQGSRDHEIEKAFDGDILSYYENAIKQNGWIGMDLGQDSAQVITKISFCPRNDANCILPGNTYELFYWDNNWISLGQKNATGYEITFDGPQTGLFWLRCLSGGREERIFSYNQGKQLWF